MTSHESWSDKLSDYLDDELTAGARADLEAHLGECDECARTLQQLKQVVTTASALRPTPPGSDLWRGISRRIAVTPQVRSPRSFSFTLPQLAAASLLLAALSGGTVAYLLSGTNRSGVQAGTQHPDSTSPPGASGAPQAGVVNDVAAVDSHVDAPPGFDADVVPAAGYADAQFDAAVGDLERALASGRNRLDPETIAVVEDNLSIIDRAIAEARRALASDPANGFLSGHLMEARRRKLDLLRRAAALTEAN